MRPMTVGRINATCGPPTNVRSWEWNGLNAEVAIGPFMTQSRPRDQTGFAPEAFTTLAHFSVSSATCAPNSVGAKGIGALPMSAYSF
jgi:hypothetical protein